MAEKKPPYAEDVNFWQTSQVAPDSWIDKAMKQIVRLGGKTRGHAFGTDDLGHAAFMVMFEIEGERFKIVWPVLPTKAGNDRAARIQAATTLYHYVKATCLYAVVVGFRAAFFSHLMLPDGRTAAQLATPQLLERIPKMLATGD